MSKVGIAIIGCGPMGRDLAEAAATIDSARISAVVDTDTKLVSELAQKHGCDALTSTGEVFARDDVDAVIIATPGFTHADITIAAFAAGKHVFVEKPMALLDGDCQRMIAAAEQAEKKLMVGQVLRYIVPFVHIRSLLDEGKFGDLVSLRITRSGFGWGSWVRPWRTKAAQAGGVLFEFSVHEIDFMMHLAGDVAGVFANASHRVIKEVDYPDTWMLNLQFTNGAIGQLSAGIADRVGTYHGEIVGTKGAVHFNSSDAQIVTALDGEEKATIAYSDIDTEKAVEREVREFVEAVRDDTAVTIPGQHGARVVRVANAAIASYARGETVAVARS
jgi:predicted dehydrogenase